jgi:hypothetical protein
VLDGAPVGKWIAYKDSFDAYVEKWEQIEIEIKRSGKKGIEIVLRGCHTKLILAALPLILTLVGCELATQPLKTTPTKSEYPSPMVVTGQSVQELEQRYADLKPLSYSNISLAAELDQENRRLLSALQTKGTLTSQEEELKHRLSTLMGEKGQQNFEELMRLKPTGRWFNASELDRAGHRAAFIILQHGDISRVLDLVPDIKTAAENGLLSKQQYALFADRVAVVKGEPQEFGSQASCVNGEPVFPPVREPATVNQRRKAIGMSKTLEEYQREIIDLKMCK